MSRDTCETCRYWSRFSQAGAVRPETVRGECRYHPPRVVTVGEAEETYYEVKTVFPITDPDIWCGFYRLADHLAALQGAPGGSTATGSSS